MRRLVELFAVFFCWLLLCMGVSAQARFPNDLVGAWCGVESEGTRLDIAQAEYEEGDGVCKIRSASSVKGRGVVSYKIALVCDMGVEGKKPFPSVEQYIVFQINKNAYMLREGSLYVRSMMAIYKRC